MSVPESVHNLMVRLGISRPDAEALRRCAMTLHRWSELECGDGNAHASWAIERDEASGIPYMVTHYNHGEPKGRRRRIPDRDAGARKRIARILKAYPGLSAYVQGDPRGAPLFILPPDVSADNYNRGVAVYK